MDFKPSKTDFDLWIRPKEDYYEYVTTYVDDIFAFAKNPMVIIEEIKTTTRDLAYFENAENQVHWGQAKTYAYMYGHQNLRC